MVDRNFNYFTTFDRNVPNEGGLYRISDTVGKTGLGVEQNFGAPYLYNGENSRALVQFYDNQNNDYSILNGGERVDTLHVNVYYKFSGQEGSEETGNGRADGMAFTFGKGEGDTPGQDGTKYELGSEQGLSVSMLPFEDVLRVTWNGEVIGSTSLAAYNPEELKDSHFDIKVTADGEVTVVWGGADQISGEVIDPEGYTVNATIPNNEWQTTPQDGYQLWMGGRTGANAGKGWIDNVRIDAHITDAVSPIPCFTSGTLIETNQGNKPVEELQPGDMIATLDDGYQPIRWIGSTKRDAVDLAHNPKLLPIRIPAGALGNGLPKRDLMVSRQHRVLVRSKIAQRMFGAEEILIPANKLVGMSGIEIAGDVEDVTYFHILFDKHQVIFSEDAPTESLFTGPVALQSVPPEARKEIETLFPQITEPDFIAEPARLIPEKGKQIKQLVERHGKHGLPMLNG
ncbi:Hint domain-containing protein [Paracoccus methylarcula]|nr:Hint domain-containing protein [Paracoccus methylarcula]